MAEVRGENLFHVLMDEEVMASLSTKARTGLGEMMVTVAHYHDEADNLRVSDIYDGLLTGTGYVRALGLLQQWKQMVDWKTFGV